MIKIDLNRYDLNVIIPLVRNFRNNLDSIDSYESIEHDVLDKKKKYLDSLIEKLFNFSEI